MVDELMIIITIFTYLQNVLNILLSFNSFYRIILQKKKKK